MVDPDLELRDLRGGPSFVLLALPAFLPSVISSFFLPKIRGGGGGAGPSPRSATEESKGSGVENAIKYNVLEIYEIFPVSCLISSNQIPEKHYRRRTAP